MLGFRNQRSYYITVAVLAVCLLVLSACSAEKSMTLLAYQENLAGAAVTWEYGGTEYKASITFDGAVPDDPASVRAATVTVTSPEEISGMTVSYTPEGAAASVGGVSFVLPENMGREVYRIVRSLSLYKDEMKGAGNGSGTVTAVRFEVPLYGGVTEYDITYNDEKYPESAVITWDGGETMTVRYEGFEDGILSESETHSDLVTN